MGGGKCHDVPVNMSVRLIWIQVLNVTIGHELKAYLDPSAQCYHREFPSLDRAFSVAFIG